LLVCALTNVRLTSLVLLWLVVVRPPPRPPLFPYTTLFRSPRSGGGPAARAPRPGNHRCRRRRVIPAPGKQTARHGRAVFFGRSRSEEHTSELQSRENLVCRLLLEKKRAGIHSSAGT